jgi:beta-phosphoglucomutase-like phosphatase (HAD superfamily)
MGIPPARCAVVEDAPPGVEAANAAGAASIGFASTGRTAESLSAARLAIHSLAELSPDVVRGVILPCGK